MTMIIIIQSLHMIIVLLNQTGIIKSIKCVQYFDKSCYKVFKEDHLYHFICYEIKLFNFEYFKYNFFFFFSIKNLKLMCRILSAP